MYHGSPGVAGNVDGLDGGEAEKERLRTILATITGEMSVTEACEHLGLGRARFAELRHAALQAACDGLVPGDPGRPRTKDPERDEEISELRSEIDRLESERNNAVLRAELARALPHLFSEMEKGGSRLKRKTSKDPSE